MAQKSKTTTFEGKVETFDPNTKVIGLEGGKTLQLGASSRQTLEVGQRVKYTVANKDVKKLGGTKPVTVTRLEKQDAASEPASGEKSAPSSGGVQPNTRDNR